MKKWRFLNTGVSSGAYNMAVDRAILEDYSVGRAIPTLRIYQWSPPAVSLGYFQRRHSIDSTACGSRGIDIVRRPTGGRAVLHFNDISYSVVAGSCDGIPPSLEGSYQLISEGLRRAFSTLGFDTELGSASVGDARSDICFLTAAAADILYKGKKIAGSAQTRSKDSMLQHGSIILDSRFKLWPGLLKADVNPEVCEKFLKRKTTSVKEILGYILSVDTMAEAIKSGMNNVMGAEFKEDGLSPEEVKLVNKYINECGGIEKGSSKRVNG